MITKKVYNKVNPISAFVEKNLDNYNEIKAFVITTERKIEIVDNENFDIKGNLPLKKAQELVGGYIEYVFYINDKNFNFIVDEEGIMKQKDFNLLAYTITGHMFYGNVLITRKGGNKE